MKKIVFDHNPKVFNHEGVHSFITTEFDSVKYYGNRKSKFPLGLKIFKQSFNTLETFNWKFVNLLDATKIQNIFWFHGLAPRVYDIVEVDLPIGRRLAQVTEILPESERGDLDKKVWDKMFAVIKEYGIRRISVDPNPNHRYQRYMVDFSQMEFSSGDYRKKLELDLVKDAGWGSNPATYQSVDELGVVGQRNLEGRLSAYKWDEIDFTGKTVLDYGCSSGQVARECLRRGAKYVVGLELPRAAKVAFELSNYLGYFNIDYYGDNFQHSDNNNVYQKIKEYTGESKFDIVLYLSVMQLKRPPYLKEIVGETFFLEGHTADKEETYRPWLEQNFSQVEFLGASKDHSIRPVFRCSV